MPWDPAPVPASAAQANSSSTSQTHLQPPKIPKQEPAPQKQGTTGLSFAASKVALGSQVKNEPGSGGYDLQNLPQTNGASASYSNSGAALDRTSQQLQEKFGAAAATQISQLQARRTMMGQGQPQQSPVSQAELEAKRRVYNQMSAQQHAAQMAQQQRAQHGVGSAQTDGASDWASFVAERRAMAAAHGDDADASLRQMLEASAVDMEGGGVMKPVTRQRPSKARLARALPASSSVHDTQFDGPGADDDDDKDLIKEDDEDAINSDLDDPEDELDKGEEEDDADKGEIMLCTYDKVQRVKNKWKCTLKDGILTTGGKESVIFRSCLSVFIVADHATDTSSTKPMVISSGDPCQARSVFRDSPGCKPVASKIVRSVVTTALATGWTDLWAVRRACLRHFPPPKLESPTTFIISPHRRMHRRRF